MDIEKTKENIGKILNRTIDYCSTKSIDECNTSDCILNPGHKDCIKNLLDQIYFKLRSFKWI